MVKYLDLVGLIGVNSYLNSIDAGDGVLQGCVEGYSCKIVGADKKIFKSIDKELEEAAIISTSVGSLGQHQGASSLNAVAGGGGGGSNGSGGSLGHHHLQLPNSYNSSSLVTMSTSPFGPMTSSASRKSLIYLIQTLNSSFVDYDFSDTKPDQFRKESSIAMVMNSINTIFSSCIPNYQSEFKDSLWSSIDSEIGLYKSDIYSYIPESPDPFTEDGV
eukprot:gene10897-13352_t